MSFNSDIHHRRSIRLRDYDYSQAGAYFVTICAWTRECLFGEIVDGKMILNEMGRIVCTAWTDLPNHYKHIILDEAIVMPNHVHGIIDIVGAGLKPAPTEKQHALPEIIRGFKTFSSRRINVLRNNPGCYVWQRNYYEAVGAGLKPAPTMIIFWKRNSYGKAENAEPQSGGCQHRKNRRAVPQLHHRRPGRKR